jgi:hypothetical protein
MKPFPKMQDRTLQEVVKVMEYITKERRNDVADFDNLKNVFMSGRKVGKIPTSPTDIDVTDRVGDFNYDPDYIYLCVDDGGAEWRRTSLSWSGGGGGGGGSWGSITGTLSSQTDLQTELNAKVSTSALNELVDDRVAALLVAGGGITLTYDDTANTLTIEAIAGW